MHRGVKMILNIWGQGKRSGELDSHRSYWNQKGTIKTYITWPYTLIGQENRRIIEKGNA